MSDTHEIQTYAHGGLEPTMVMTEEAPALNLVEALKQGPLETSHRDVTGFRPLRDMVLVRRCTKDEMSENRVLYTPEAAQELPMEGVVLAVGRGRFDNQGNFYPSEVKPGERVLFGRYDGTPHRLRGQEVLLMKESCIQGVLIV